MNLNKEILSFFKELKEYKNLLEKPQPPKRKTTDLREKLVRRFGQLSPHITEVTEKQYVERGGRVYEIWSTGLTANPSAPINSIALDYCIDNVNETIGKLEAEIKMGIRDEHGNPIKKPCRIDTEPSKAFIAHGGKSEACDKLCRFLVALGITPLIIEEQPKEGRSVNEQVEHYSEQADCAIIIGTADDKELKDGKLYPRRNVYIEIGRFQEKFPNRIIYLLEEGASFPSNISEKLYTHFTQESMDEALITVARELTAFGIVKSVKPQIQESKS